MATTNKPTVTAPLMVGEGLPSTDLPRSGLQARDGRPIWSGLAQIVRVVIALVLAFVPFASAPTAWAQSAHDIIAAADKVRNASDPFRMTLTLTEYVRSQPKDSTVLVVYSKEDKASGQFRNLVRYVEPPRDAGKMALLDGQNLWFYDPAAKASVRISTQQRLIGQASIGDVLTVNFAIDYSGTLLPEETITDAEKQQRNCWHLDLRAATPTAVYSRAEYWVEKGTFHPVKTKFWSDSGRVLKALYYRDFVQRLGGVRPGSAVIIDAVDSTLVTTVRFDNPTFRDIPDFWYQRDYLPRLRPE
jgi:outer membrane lipoprotein-sorting protein